MLSDDNENERRPQSIAFTKDAVGAENNEDVEEALRRRQLWMNRVGGVIELPEEPEPEPETLAEIFFWPAVIGSAVIAACAYAYRSGWSMLYRGRKKDDRLPPEDPFSQLDQSFVNPFLL